MLHTKKSFDGVDVELDGNGFDGCTFKNCRLIFRGGELPNPFAHNAVEHSDFKLEGAAKQTVLFGRFLTTLGVTHVLDLITAEMRKPL